MQPKIGYLIDSSVGWGDAPDWQFYEEDAVPRYKIEHAPKETYKRIVYWEMADAA